MIDLENKGQPRGEETTEACVIYLNMFEATLAIFVPIFWLPYNIQKQMWVAHTRGREALETSAENRKYLQSKVPETSKTVFPTYLKQSSRQMSHILQTVRCKFISR